MFKIESYADPNINSLWVKYNEEQNKDWNSINNNWKKYTKSFINKPNCTLWRWAWNAFNYHKSALQYVYC
nr:hypothetical protein [Mycoplasmopsis bovis]